MRVGLAATKAVWSTQLRSYIHDHVAGLTVDAVLDPGQLNQPGRPRLDVLVIDDATRLLTGADIGAAVAAGTLVVGLFNPRHRSGRDTLERLGVSYVYSVETPTSDLAGAIAAIGLLTPPPPPDAYYDQPDRVPRPSHWRGALTVMSAATGGSGLTEAVIGVANQWAATQHILVIEANPMAATMAARLRRPTGFGLSWALGLAAQGQAIFPAALTPSHGPEGRGLGDFDVICQSSMPGAPAPASPTHLEAVVDAALSVYDHVLIEIGPLVLESTPSLDRFAAGRAMLTKADQAIVVARSDPEAVIHLAEWKAAARTLAVGARCWAVFGRTPKGNYELSQLTASLQATTASDAGSFAGIRSLPEDPQVAKARWNAEMVGRSRWLSAVERLARDLATPTVTATRKAAGPAAAPPVPVQHLAVSKAWS
jgi:hypothetical protein